MSLSDRRKVVYWGGLWKYIFLRGKRFNDIEQGRIGEIASGELHLRAAQT